MVVPSPKALHFNPAQKHGLKPLSTIWDELTDADFPARPPSAPSNIETISLWGPRYPGQKLHPELEDVMPSIEEDPVPVVPEEPDDVNIWDTVASLCSVLRSLIDKLPLPDKEDQRPHGPVSSAHLQESGELFIQSLEPLRPLLPGKLADPALEKVPDLVPHVRELEHRFDDLERLLEVLPRVFEEITYDQCQVAMREVEAIMWGLGVGCDTF